MSKTRTDTPTTNPGTPDTREAIEVAAPTQRVPAYAAGSGYADTALSAIPAEYSRSCDESCTATATSPDGRLRIEFGPETLRYQGNPTGALWLITYTDPDQPRNRWAASFGDNCPGEAIAAFIQALTDPEGLDPEREYGI